MRGTKGRVRASRVVGALEGIGALLLPTSDLFIRL